MLEVLDVSEAAKPGQQLRADLRATTTHPPPTSMSAAEAAPLASPSKSVEEGGGAEAELPKALVKRVIKAGLAQWDVAAGGDGKRDFQVNKDALLACSEAGKLFIHYLVATANDACKDAKRQTVSADDVLTALEDLDFGELVEPLRAALEAYRLENKEKARKRTEAGKKRKAAGAADEEAAPVAEQQQQQQQEQSEAPAPAAAAEPGAS